MDFGEILIAPEVGGVRIRRGTGALWRIRGRTDPITDDLPPPAASPSTPSGPPPPP